MRDGSKKKRILSRDLEKQSEPSIQAKGCVERRIQGSENSTYKNGKGVGGEVGEMNRD